MKFNRRGDLPPLRFFFVLIAALAVGAATTFARGKSETRTWIVDGEKREALIVFPADDAAKVPIPSPVVIVFHGHGGTMGNAAQSFRIHELWPEALVVYPQGLHTTGKITDREGTRSGWQFAAGDQNDRDLKFFDTIIETLKHEGRLDTAQLFVAGHSNGGAFVLLLWLERGKSIAAFASSSAVMRPPYTALPPARVFFISGEKDELVKYSWQAAMYEALCRHFDCVPTKKNENGVVVADSKAGAHLVAFIHPGSHQFPSDAPQLIVDFFREAEKQNHASHPTSSSSNK